MNTSSEKDRSAPKATGASRRARLMMHVVMVMLAMLVGLGGVYHFVGDRGDVASQNLDDVLGRISRVVVAPRRAEPPLGQRSVSWMSWVSLMSDGPLKRNAERLAEAAKTNEVHLAVGNVSERSR